ncbi:MAG: sialidase family protein [Acidobacteriota bacterium]
MRRRLFSLISVSFLVTFPMAAQSKKMDSPTWWGKYQYIVQNGSDPLAGTTTSVADGTNVDVSNECGPQSETYITLDTSSPKRLAAGSNEIFRLPMRGYYSTNGGTSWGGVDLPLPAPIGTNGIDFGSDPTLAFDSSGNLFYGYIVVHFSNGNGINGTQMAVARSTNGGRTYQTVTFFGFEGGSSHFNDKPMITADANPRSPFRDSVYIAWDAASGGSAGGGVRLARSTDHGATFTTTRIDDPRGPGRAIAAVPFVGPQGQLYVAWNDYAANTIAFTRSTDGGATFAPPSVIAAKKIPFDIAIPAELTRAALVYPACDVNRSSSNHPGRLYCSWMDLTAQGTTDILISHSDDNGSSWSASRSVGDTLAFAVDRFNQWLSVDPTSGEVTVSFYDTRNDTTGFRYMTDTYLSRSLNGGTTFKNVRVSNESSNEHDCDGIYPCTAINYGNQQGDYEGLVTYGGIAHPVWTDSRRQRDILSGCRGNLAMEEVFTAAVK